ncbi:MAG: hypothetical protein F4Y31_09780 [Gammaproteobacteria bacterium]|nr:hypothetical protein [Gammaproteobacteria bacterium]MYF67863.1 hypothetical protein [Gammaproteobacteria bacterium]MYK37854.1 hypothetical protein [Gammaproteobacteria bacterium]
MIPRAIGNGGRLEHARALAAIAVRDEAEPQRWRGYFERLLSGETIGPLPFDAGGALTTSHSVSGQYAFRFLVGPDESPGSGGPALRTFRDCLEQPGERDVAIGVDLSGIVPDQFGAWLDALIREIRRQAEVRAAVPPVVFSLRAEHPARPTLLKALRDSGGAGTRAALRVDGKTFREAALWEELVRASHADPRIELVLSGRKQPLTDLMGSEKPDTIMPLSLFEAPADTAWLGMQFDLSAIPAEQIERGTGHLKKLVRVGVRLADNLIDAVTWPSEQLRRDALANRRLAAHVTGIGDLVLRHGLDPASFSTLRLLQRWLTLFKRQLLRESLRLAEERGPYPALNADQLVRTLAPRYGDVRARRIISRRSPRHRQLLALSPYCVLPRRANAIPARKWLNLLPLVRVADNLTMHGSQVRSLLDRADYERLLRSTWALLRAGQGP